WNCRTPRSNPGSMNLRRRGHERDEKTTWAVAASGRIRYGPLRDSVYGLLKLAVGAPQPCQCASRNCEPGGRIGGGQIAIDPGGARAAGRRSGTYRRASAGSLGDGDGSDVARGERSYFQTAGAHSAIPHGSFRGARIIAAGNHATRGERRS